MHLVIANKDAEARAGATALAADLDRLGVEVLLDDRQASPGVKFKDAELLGVPWIVVVGRGWADGVVELRDRFSWHTRELAVGTSLATEITRVGSGLAGPVLSVLRLSVAVEQSMTTGQHPGSGWWEAAHGICDRGPGDGDDGGLGFGQYRLGDQRGQHAAAAPTTTVLAAGADEVSEQIAALFSAHAHGYRTLSAQAAAFHEQFVQALRGARRRMPAPRPPTRSDPEVTRSMRPPRRCSGAR